MPIANVREKCEETLINKYEKRSGGAMSAGGGGMFVYRWMSDMSLKWAKSNPPELFNNLDDAIKNSEATE